MRFPLKVVEECIKAKADEIKALDEKSLPMLLAELQGEEAALIGADNHREITEVSLETIEFVLPCWSYDDKFDQWIKSLVKATEALNQYRYA